MKKYFLILIMMATSLSAVSQTTWRNTRHGFVMAAGGNIFMGDLGGGSKKGTHIFALDDVDPHFLKVSEMLGYNYKLTDHLQMGVNVIFSMVGADDANSSDETRRNRNLNFKSTLLDVGATLNYYFVREKDLGRMESVAFKNRLSAYFFVGMGLLHFNPQGKIEGQWYELKPLCTEGQGTGKRFEVSNNGTPQVVEANQPYKLCAMTIPIGLGIKCQLTPNISVGLEFAQRFTTTDYIDDCSAYYFNYAAEGVAPPSDMTPLFADKRLVVESGDYAATGAPRGNPGYNDSYFTGMVTLCYRFFSNSGNNR